MDPTSGTHNARNPSWRRGGSGWRARPFNRGRDMVTTTGKQFNLRGVPAPQADETGQIHDSWNALTPIASLGEIASDDVHSSLAFTGMNLRIEDCDFVASYSWLDRTKPTILVPGEPPVWSPPIIAPKLDQDSGCYFRDPNAARYARYPSEPIVRAAFAMQPELDPAAVDIFGCGSTLGNLLRFADSSDRTFRFHAELVGDTVFLVRKENSPRELIPGVYGYGHTFPEAYTSWAQGAKDSVSNQRLIKYSFGGIRCHVRFESDGYLRNKAMFLDDPSSDKPCSIGLSQETGIDSLLTNLKSAAVSEKPQTENATFLIIENGGRLISQNAVFDIKTRATRSVINMDEVLPRLWISQIPNFIIAYHKSGNFDDIRVQDMRPDIADWEKQNATLIRRFYSILRRLIQLFKESDSRKFEVRRIGTGHLKIWKQDEGRWSALPRDLRARWSGQSLSDNEDSEDSVQASKDAGSTAYEDSEDDADDYLKF